MSDHWSDDERVAAFLDGRMDEAEREEMVARLGRSGEDRDVLAATALILRQLEEAEAGATTGQGTSVEEGAPPVAHDGSAGPEAAAEIEGTAEPEPVEGVISLESRRATGAKPVRDGGGKGVRVLGGLALAAAVVTLAVVTRSVLQDDDGLSGEPLRVARDLPRGLSEHWLDNRPWGTRGGGTSDSVSPEQRSALSSQAGMMLVDLAVAVEARDSAKTHVLATQIGERFDSLTWERGALGEIANHAGANPKRLRSHVHDATARLAARMDSAALRLGVWTEAAGLAAERRNARFFRDSDTARLLDGAEQVTAADPEATEALREVRRLLGTNPPSWELLVPALDRLARELATE